MDFLRRLHPGRAAAPEAARLDLAPRWLDAAPMLSDADTTALPRAAQVARPPRAQPFEQATAVESAARDDTGTAPGESARAVLTPARATTPGAAPTAPSDIARPEPLHAPTTVSGLPPTGTLAAIVTQRRASPQLDGSNPSAAREAGAGPAPHHPAAMPIESMSARATPDRPLRVAALVERPLPPAAAQAPIVHVTIDRIDVRLPATAAPPPGRERRARATSAVAPLSDYLRGPQRGGRG